MFSIVLMCLSIKIVTLLCKKKHEIMIEVKELNNIGQFVVFQTGDLIFFIVCLVVFMFSFGTAINAFLYPRMGRDAGSGDSDSNFLDTTIRSIVDHTFWPTFGEVYLVASEMGSKFPRRNYLFLAPEVTLVRHGLVRSHFGRRRCDQNASTVP